MTPRRRRERSTVPSDLDPVPHPTRRRHRNRLARSDPIHPKSSWQVGRTVRLTSALGHSHRYCHVRSLVRYPQHRTLPRPAETHLLAAFLRPFCKQRAQPPQLLRPGFGLQQTCERSAAGVLVWFFCSIAVWRRTSQEKSWIPAPRMLKHRVSETIDRGWAVTPDTPSHARPCWTAQKRRVLAFPVLYRSGAL